MTKTNEGKRNTTQTESDSDDEDDWYYCLPSQPVLETQPQTCGNKSSTDMEHVGHSANSEPIEACDKQLDNQEEVPQLEESQHRTDLLDKEQTPDEVETVLKDDEMGHQGVDRTTSL